MTAQFGVAGGGSLPPFEVGKLIQPETQREHTARSRIGPTRADGLAAAGPRGTPTRTSFDGVCMPSLYTRFARDVWASVPLVTLLALAAFTAPTARGDEPKKGVAPKDAKSLYDSTKVWTVHLKFAADQWAAIEPKRPDGPGGGGANDARRIAKAAEMLATVVMGQGDGDRDGGLAAEEFAALGRKWFKAWDKGGAGKVTEKQLTAWVDATPSPVGGGMTLVGAEGKRNGLVSAFGMEFEYVHADLEFEDQVLKDVAVRYKGNGTFLTAGNTPKRPFKINLDKYQKGLNLGGVTTLNLQNGITDASWMNEVLAYRLFRDADVPAPRTAYARVYVTVPGQYDRKYLGLYSLSENVDQHFADDHFTTKKKGAIFKPVTPMLFADLGADWAAYNQMYDPKWKPTDGQKKAVTDLCRLVTQADDKEFAARVGDFIDLPEFARYLAVVVYLSDLDGILGPGQNLYLYLHPDTNKLVFIPWDQDWSWGQFARASQDQRNRLSLLRPWQGEKPFLERMLKVEAFKKAYLRSLEEFGKTIFDPDRIAKQVDEVAAAIRPVVKEEPVASLDRFDQVVAGKVLPPVRREGFGGGGDTQPIKPFAKVRTQSVLEQLAGKSDGLTLGSGGPGRPPGRGDALTEMGSLVSGPLYRLLAADKQTELTEAEVVQGFEQLFKSWDTEKGGKLGYTYLRAGIEKSFTPAKK